MRFLVVPFIVLLLAAATIAVADTPPKPVKTMTITQGAETQARVFFGRVTAKQTVDLAFQVAGQIREFPVVEGDVIQRGDLVARLDPEPFALAVERARISKDQADRAVARFQKLKGNTVSKVTVDDATSQASIAAVALKDAAYAQARSVMQAPFDALVASRTVANFTTVGAGTTVVRLHDMSELRIDVSVPEVLFQRIGTDAEVDLQAQFPTGEMRYPVEFREINAEASAVGQTFQVTLGMAPPEGLNLLPGSSVMIHAAFQRDTVGFTVPASAIYTDTDGTTSVMRLVKDATKETVQKVAVTLLVNDKGTLEITSGVSAGDVSVATGVQDLSDGQAVRHFTSF